MSACGTVKRFANATRRKIHDVASKICNLGGAFDAAANWLQARREECVDRGYEDCAREEDHGYNNCVLEAKTKNCCDWWPCSWGCKVWTWVEAGLCLLWVWVKNIVCVAWIWVSKIVCVVVTYVLEYPLRALAKINEVGCDFTVSYFIDYPLKWLFGVILSPCEILQILWPSRYRQKLDHIFVLVLENRSFDHMLGFVEIEGTDALDGRRRFAKGLSGNESNWVADRQYSVRPGQSRAVEADPPHEFYEVQEQLYGALGAFKALVGIEAPPVNNSGFASAYRKSKAFTDHDDPGLVMECYVEEDIPVMVQLCREFVLLERWFAAVPGPTWPNRFFIHAASSGGLDHSPGTPEIASAMTIDGYRFNNGTLFDLLDSEGIPWAIYHGDNTPQVAACAGMTWDTILQNYHDLKDFKRDLTNDYGARYTFIEPDYGRFIRAEYQCGNSQHPRDDVTFGDGLIKYVYEAIRNSPLWEKSCLIVTWDEGGGFYDHVAPPRVRPPGDKSTDESNNKWGFDFSQLGHRVPAIFCSPWVPRNLLDPREYEHSSIPATVERNWDLPSLTQRDKQARDLLSLLTLRSPRLDCPSELVRPARASLRECGEDESISNADSTATIYRTLLSEEQVLAARDADSKPIGSEVAGFLQVALRLDLMSRPREEHRPLQVQTLTFDTAGEAWAYIEAVQRRLYAIKSDPRYQQVRIQPDSRLDRAE